MEWGWGGVGWAVVGRGVVRDQGGGGSGGLGWGDGVGLGWGWGEVVGGWGGAAVAVVVVYEGGVLVTTGCLLHNADSSLLIADLSRLFTDCY